MQRWVAKAWFVLWGGKCKMGSRWTGELQLEDGKGVLLPRIARVQLLIIDDFLLTPLADWERRGLLEIAEDCYQSGATVITSQCPIRDWHPNIGDAAMAEVIWDRLLHNAYKIELKGDSMRKNQS